ncbi:hypothetical protein SHKM778_00690 [Streptomyces sp. KM77-8]|uniref:Molybdopterin-guanine dinucleotide biosynthesis protein MobA n=1 Tax=Streptomyces haneummycinicus TaxID=3074435 RepID=A0AAT9H8H8_9ACTN
MASFDCDTWDDIATARARIREHGHVLDEWISAVKDELGIDLDVDTGALLDLARDAAHGVARPAAPLTTFLVGYAAAHAGGGPEAVAEAARKATALALRWAEEDTPDATDPAPPPARPRDPPGQGMTARAARAGQNGDDLDVEEALALVKEHPGGTPGTPGHPRHDASDWTEARALAERAPRHGTARRTGYLPPSPSPSAPPWASPSPPPHRPHRPALLRHLGDGRLGGVRARPLVRTRRGCPGRAHRARAPHRRRRRPHRHRRPHPPDTTAVLRSEHGRTDDKGRLHVTADTRPPHTVTHGQDIRPRGQECRSGDQLLPMGTLITPPVLGMAAAAGYDTLTAVPARAPRCSSSATNCSPTASRTTD